jgi:NAD(P)-dependent dehydrogenase (short-subunit alcohol dehydrogenase family)
MILKDKVVIITGVGPGMGQAAAKIAAEEGAKVAMAARNLTYLEEVATEIRKKGGQAIAVKTDVTNRAQCDNLVAAAMKAFGRIDGLVNSAYATGENETFEQADVEKWGPIFDAGATSAARMSQAVLPHMKAQGGGAIVNVASLQSFKPLPGGALSYAIAKGAMVTISRQLAVELGPYNIRVNATRIGWMWGQPVKNALTHMAQQTGSTVEKLAAEVAARIPLRVVPPEEECARTVLMFVSDYTKMVTGAILDVNGGEWLPP